MKKLSMFCEIALVLGLLAGPALAVDGVWKLDFYGGDTTYVQGDFETEIELKVYDTVYADVWLTGTATPPDIAAILFVFEWSTDSIEVVSIAKDHLAPKGPPPASKIWDAANVNLLDVGKYKCDVNLLSGGNPGPDFKLHTVELHCIAEGTDWVSVGLDKYKIMDENGDFYTDAVNAICTVYQLAATTTTTTVSPSTTTTTTTTTTSSAITTSSTIFSTTTTVRPTPDTTTTTTKKCLSKKIYGEDSEETELLRYFRDNVLSQTPEGQEIIRLYYERSPVIINAMEEDEESREEVKTIIDGILSLIRADVE